MVVGCVTHGDGVAPGGDRCRRAATRYRRSVGIGRAARIGTAALAMTVATAVTTGCSSAPSGPSARPTAAPDAAAPPEVTESPTVVAAVAPIGKVGVLLPPAGGPPAGWVTAHRSQLAVALGAVGLDPVVPDGPDADRASAAVDAMVAAGAKVIVVGADGAAATAAVARAKAAGIATVGYRRLVAGADVAVTVDDEAAGRLQGDGLVKCLADKGVARPRIVELEGPADAAGAAAAKRGYDSVLEPRFASGEMTRAGGQTAPTAADGAALFRSMVTAAEARVDGVLAGDDGLAAAAVGVLRENGLSVPVTGRGATIAALRNLLTGAQCMTVGEAPAALARLAAVAAAALAEHKAVPGVLAAHDDATGAEVPVLRAAPVAVVRSTVKTMVDDGEVTVAELCADLVERCAAAGIPSK